MTKAKVQVDAELSDLIPGFLARKRADLRRIAAAADDHDYAELRELGHRLKGEGGSFGLDGISLIGAEIERAAEARDPRAVRRCGAELSEYLESVDIVYV
jgi:HPt (histidine-containing phosphotransfer) domain-containing protein